LGPFNLEGTDIAVKQEAFEEQGFVSRLVDRTNSTESLNRAVDIPCVLELLDSLTGKSIIDFGCGNGSFLMECLKQDAVRADGIELSTRLANMAAASADPERTEIFLGDICEFESVKKYDLAASCMVMHYIQDAERALARIRASLKPHSIFVMSVRHPIRTANPIGLNSMEGGWVCRKYFEEGERSWLWLGCDLTIYHRTIGTWHRMLRTAGFEVDEIREPRPSERDTAQNISIADHLHIPGILTFRAIAF
jgi:SAM-dependent methyltransferase